MILYPIDYLYEDMEEIKEIEKKHKTLYIRGFFILKLSKLNINFRVDSY